MLGNPNIKASSVAKYMLLPGIIPWVKDFAQTGFGNLAYLMAVIYYSVRLLPANHPYLSTANIGRFGIRHVIAAAANNLVLSRQNIDQIVVFFALLLGFVILVMQFVLLGAAFLFQPAMASGGFIGMFGTPNPTYDVAFMMLDHVFGIPDLYNSCVAQQTACGPRSPNATVFPTPFHHGLHALFYFYNLAILLIGVLIFLYYVLIVVGETAQSGTPFGKRFNHVWAPIRLVVALGLLVPLSHGLNSAQYITLHAAKAGSGFATNAWATYNSRMTNNIFGMSDARNLIAKPTPPLADHLMKYVSMAFACKVGYETIYSPNSPTHDNQSVEIKPYLVKSPMESREITGPNSPSWRDAVEFYNNQDVVIIFGHKDEARYQQSPGGVSPLCGEITVHTKDLSMEGTRISQEGYYKLIMELWMNDSVREMAFMAGCLHLTPKPDEMGVPGAIPCPTEGGAQLPDTGAKQDLANWTNARVQMFVEDSYDVMISFDGYGMTSEILARGWGGAGIWYNKIAQWNGAFTSATKAVPTPSQMPIVMDKVQEANRAANKNITTDQRFDPKLAGENPVSFDYKGEEKIAAMLNKFYQYQAVTESTGASGPVESSGNAFMDIMNFMFGFDGLFDIRKNDHVNPLAQLTAMGKSIIDSTIRNLMTALAFSVGGGLSGAFDAHIGGAVSAVSKMFVSMATIGLSIGFILYYVLPFLPFIYFFFAVSGWVKTIFEAMVGVPLWALAHLRIDGQGLPGDNAMSGYFLIFEIFLRPILIVFSLVASVGIFSALARTLNGIFTLATDNMTGFDCFDAASCNNMVHIAFDYSFKRSIIDEFFFTVLYTMLVYMLATASFKLIHQIPNGLTRWMSAGIQSFTDQAGDPAGNLVQYAAFGGARMSGQVIDALDQGAKTVGEAGGSAAKGLMDMISRNPQANTTGESTGGTGGAGGSGGTGSSP